MAAGVYNIEIEQGASFSVDINIANSDQNYSFGDYSFKATVRDKYTDASPTASFTIAEDNSSKKLTMAMSNTSTAALSSGAMIWDLIQIKDSDSSITRILQGDVIVSPMVTRSND